MAQSQFWNVSVFGKLVRMNLFKTQLIFIQLDAPLVVDGETYGEVVTKMENIPDADFRRIQGIQDWAQRQDTVKAPRVIVLQVRTDSGTGPNHLPMATIVLPAREEKLHFAVLSQATDLMDTMNEQDRYDGVNSALTEALRTFITHVREEARAEERHRDQRPSNGKPAPRSGNGNGQPTASVPATAKLPEPEPEAVPDTITAYVLDDRPVTAPSAPNGNSDGQEEARLAVSVGQGGPEMALAEVPGTPPPSAPGPAKEEKKVRGRGKGK